MVKTNNSAPAPMPSGLDGHMPVEIIHMDAKKTPEQNDAKEAEKKETKEETKEEQRTFFDQVRDEVETSGDSDIRLASARYPEVISTEEADKLAELRGKKETFTEKDHAQQIEQLAQLEAELTLLIRMSGMIDERYSEQIPDPSSRSKIVILASNKLIENNKDTKVAEQFRQAIDESEDDNIDSTTALRKAQEQIKSLSSFLESGTKPLDTFLEENKADKQLDEILEKPDNIVRIFAGDSLQEIVGTPDTKKSDALLAQAVEKIKTPGTAHNLTEVLEGTNEQVAGLIQSIPGYLAALDAKGGWAGGMIAMAINWIVEQVNEGGALTNFLKGIGFDTQGIVLGIEQSYDEVRSTRHLLETVTKENISWVSFSDEEPLTAGHMSDFYDVCQKLEVPYESEDFWSVLLMEGLSIEQMVEEYPPESEQERTSLISTFALREKIQNSRPSALQTKLTTPTFATMLNSIQINGMQTDYARLAQSVPRVELEIQGA